MDLAEPFVITENQNLYIFVVVDVATCYIIAQPLLNKQSDSVTKTLMSIFRDYGIVIVGHFIQSDNSHQFCNDITDASVRLITNTLRKLSGQDFRNWDEILPTIQLCCNMKVRPRSESSSFFLMFARKMNWIGDYSQEGVTDKTVC
ncbi:hypothetical protein PHYBLDRAFT_59244 [Phycomyces blakesleeanus NRRL 1555(-)]|uniref:Integrase catalytic domain-containing protein n=1 Tax=Phycomyces blakesleeanus (strain ATCC 8743b / DSM 1359 / FGSC 10004 / NBRC 33097 / NRRL 1555) TaxID=763407 RepID=A0A162V5V7_PHYB8|nr:hypothetical protein PHYBLDRAFT_59244 [Phycomyces blakesleeanus NRRL 1555(-)]OAD80213.1 hypothetical protein PHYBLDRAFT_59244 [Phycomyces blakesleeanus NRRL 1555(-)]|eukprot:XP_018298253.1 hypothetical protein PHYBLDRAFT_59244 [Phycomyces blakesleeanus NRRL 1555(-)]